MSTSILKQVADLISLFIARLFNLSLETGEFPEQSKVAAITPIAKKLNIDASDVSCYRPITNLSVLSKLLERVVAAQLVDYLRTYNLMPPLQSGFRPGHSTETAVLKVLSDIRQAVDQDDVAALMFFGPLGCFRYCRIDHGILLQPMYARFGIQDTGIRWFRSYLINRKQFVGLADTSSLSDVISGVAHGSVIGPLLFILYTADLIKLIETHDLSAHLCADDTQIITALVARVMLRIYPLDSLAVTLLLLLPFGCYPTACRTMLTGPTSFGVLTGHRQHQLLTSGLVIDGALVSSSSSVRDLGVLLDSDLSVRSQVHMTVSKCFWTIRQQRSIPLTVFKSAVAALVNGGLDYCNIVCFWSAGISTLSSSVGSKCCCSSDFPAWSL
jgi:hypothetical protein